MKEFIDKLIEELKQKSQIVSTPLAEVECLKLSDAIGAVKSVAEECKLFGNSEQVDDGWIPVSSGKLPKGGDDVIVSYKDRYINHEDGTCDGFYDEVNQMWHLNDYEYCESAEVIAWRKRLAPYEQKGE